MGFDAGSAIGDAVSHGAQSLTRGAREVRGGVTSAWKKIRAESERTAVGRHFGAPFTSENLREFGEKAGAASPYQQLVINPQNDALRAQKENFRSQRRAQEQSLREASSQRRAGDVAKNKANRKSPNIAALLSAAAAIGAGGLTSTMLSGFSGGLGGRSTNLGGRS